MREAPKRARRRAPAGTETTIVAIGGSAGSLAAIERLLSRIDAHVPAVFIVVTHRVPEHAGMMAEILSGFTKMAVRAVVDANTKLEPSTVYVTPPDRRIIVKGLQLSMGERPLDRSRSAIDAVLRCVAAAAGRRGVGVLLTGMGSDGTAGLRAIKRAGGVTMAQDPSSAAYDQMPRSAIASGAVDVVASPEVLGDEIMSLLDAATRPRTERDPLDTVLSFLRARTGHDFASYKRSTIERRVERRMQEQKVTELRAYVDLLERDPSEVERLFDDLLIGVTSFFRDPASFEALRDVALPALLEGRANDRPLRAWVAGCATGEEAYSLAIAICESCERKKAPTPAIQIYATDLDKEAISRARQGFYPLSIAADVSPERLTRYFVHEDSGYRIKKEIRDTVVFATQNMISDPPFTRLDILSCRNVLIYLNADLQKKLLPLFFHALTPGGILVLGGSESIHGFDDAFEPVHSRWKIFRRRASARGLERRIEFPTRARAGRIEDPRREPVPEMAGIAADLTRAILEHTAPAVVVVTATGEIVSTSPAARRFFATRSTKDDVFGMARGDLGIDVRLALRKAIDRRAKVVEKGIRVKTGGRRALVDLTVRPLRSPEAVRGLFMIVVEEAAPPSRVPTAARGKEARAGAALDLRRAKAQQRALLVAMKSSEDDLSTANEELQSTNEELQSTNEELTTSKEEMQSMNEELLALNTELHSKNDALALTNADMRNLLDSLQIPTLFLDNDLRLKRFTLQAARIANLLPSDVGRPITDIRLNLHYDSLESDVRKVLGTMEFVEAHVEGTDGSSFTMRIHPYRTADDTVDGVVVAFVDVTSLERSARHAARNRLEAIVTRLLAEWPGSAWIEDRRTGRRVAASAAYRSRSERDDSGPATTDAERVLSLDDEGLVLHLSRAPSEAPQGRNRHAEAEGGEAGLARARSTGEEEAGEARGEDRPGEPDRHRS